MMRYVLFSVAALVLSCRSSEDAGPRTLEIVTPEFEVPPGDSVECFYTDVVGPSDRALGVRGGVGRQGVGGHHIQVYYTDEPRDPQHHPCGEAEMTKWHQLGGDFTLVSDNGVLTELPAGFAYRLPPGKQITIQAHYVNASGAPRTVRDTVTLDLVEESDVKTWVSHVVYSDEGFSVPAKMRYSHATTCKVTHDVNAFTLHGHMHELGAHQRIERVDTGDVLYDTDWDVSFRTHPPVRTWSTDAALFLPAGTVLRNTCTWQNDSDAPLTFPFEMCTFFGFYFPDQGPMNCQKIADEPAAD